MAKIVDEYIARDTLVKLQAVKHCCVSNATPTTTFRIVNSNRFSFLSIQFELEMYGIRKRFNCLFLAQHLRKTPIQSANYFKCYYFFFSRILFFPIVLTMSFEFLYYAFAVYNVPFCFPFDTFRKSISYRMTKHRMLADGIYNC